jgi:hypothetical protein
MQYGALLSYSHAADERCAVYHDAVILRSVLQFPRRFTPQLPYLCRAPERSFRIEVAQHLALKEGVR